MKPSKTPPVPLPVFERIARTIVTGLTVSHADLTTSCLYFGFIGASILTDRYRLPAHPVVGNAAIQVGNTVLTFDDQCTPDAFHCWVKLNGWILDFSSIVFPEISLKFAGTACERLMFQKPLDRACVSREDFLTYGGFYCEAKPMDSPAARAFLDDPSAQDLVRQIRNVYVKPPDPFKPLASRFASGKGNDYFEFSQLRLNGSWKW